MKKYFFSIVFLAAFIGFGQGNVEFKSANFKDDKDGLKKATDAIDKGDEFWELGNEAVFQVQDPGLNYWKALEQYMIAQKFNPNNAELNFKIGVCYAHSTYKVECIQYFYTANTLDPEVHPFLDYYLGMAYHLDGKFEEALKFYKTFEAEYKKADNFTKFVKQRKSECTSARDLMAVPIRAWVDHVPELSSEFDDFGPSITMDGGEICFTSNRPNNHTPNEVGRYDNDIYTSSYENGKWSKPVHAKGGLNSDGDDMTSNYSYDGTKILISRRNDKGNFDIYESSLSGDTWSNPIGYSDDINSIHDDLYASYNHNGTRFYYAKAVKTGNSGYDVMESILENYQRRDWSLPVLVGAVSSRFNDGPIYLHPDGETMYICSEGFNSMGGYDIFVSHLVKGEWTTPENMGYPINTPYDDYFFSSTASGKYAYIASNRNHPDAKGGFDIFKVTFWGPEKDPALATQDYLLASVAKPLQDPELVGEVKVTSKASLTVFKGKTIDALTKKPVEAQIEITDNNTGQIVETFTTNSATGKFLLSLNSGGNYGIAVKADGYLFHSENFDIPAGSAYNMVNKTVELKNIKIGSKIALRNVFFDVGKSTIRSESYPELDRLVKLMKDVPGLKIELSGHTDNTGSAEGNITLSQARAEAVVSYLASKGIDKSRMVAKGYGSSRPVASNDNAEGRQLNRRTEFEITGN